MQQERLEELLMDKRWVTRIIAISRDAGKQILEIYDGDEIEITQKADKSPLTQADVASHKVIVGGLQQLTPEIPVLSEESDELSYEIRRQWQTYWLVDPLDGTKEFIDRNGEFTVNIALINSGVPVLGVVYVPVKDVLYVGVQKITPAGNESYAFKQIADAPPKDIKVRPLAATLIVVASRRHGSEALQGVLRKLRRQFVAVETTNMGSSLKICLVAEGAADIYPRLAPTCEWDTAAAQAVVEAAGGMVVDSEFNVLRYNSKEALLNPFFYVIGDKSYAWHESLN
ncbi:MAG: 3'(2'),5'-bisphosphate nucleotidase CysQ [Gammaproteobacteria bacterium]|nr:3'(2'),5'-bisphosphate nucleotidase CysQ [Gammaproteobacteria bacterium]